MRIGLNEMMRTLSDIVAHDAAPDDADALVSFEDGLRRTVDHVVGRVSMGPLAP